MNDNTVTSDEKVLPELRVTWIADYLKAEGWSELAAPNHPKLRVFEEAFKGQEPLLVTLPQTPGTVDEKRRITDALTTLATEKDKTVAAIAQDILALHSDVLVWRIPNADPDHTIPVNLAADMMIGLRDLLRFGASAENDPRPYFSRVTEVGTQYMEQCRLKPTRPGSFVFEVESPLENAVPTAVKKRWAVPRRRCER